MTTDDHDLQIRRSWEANAEAWTAVVRDGCIPSRRAGTDDAILRACAAYLPGEVLDVGCGEGWLTRALAERGAEAVGVDASQKLVDRARAAGAVGGEGDVGDAGSLGAARGTGDAGSASRASYEVASYAALGADAALLPGPWKLIVCNFSLLGDPLAPLLRALAERLARGGRILIQTVHPWAAMSDGPYRDEWRIESFGGFGEHFAESMPWYSRTLESWTAELGRAGLCVEAIGEPRHPESGRPLSLLLTCARRRE